MKKRFTSIALIIAIIISLVSIPTEANAASKVTSYTYEVKPLLAPFNGYVYVKTNNPDPMSFRLIDKSSKYFSLDYKDHYGKGVYHLLKTNYADVQYENEETYRVNGGYIFCNLNGDSDGGKLIVQEATIDNPAGVTWQKGSISGYSGDMSKGWADTSTQVGCPAVKDYVDYLYDTYTDKSKSFFENMDSVQSALSSLALYPRSLYDSENTTRYPYLYPNRAHKEMGLSISNDVYGPSGKMLLLYRVYPYILDSAYFPALMNTIAKKLEPSCEYKKTGNHAYNEYTFNGESRVYGGAGNGDPGSILTEFVTKDFTFTNSSGDFGTNATIQKLKDRYMQYIYSSDRAISAMENKLTTSDIANTIRPGSWVRISGGDYSYLAIGRSEYSVKVATGAWVDGRYVNEWEMLELGATFEEHPTADIILRNMEYTDIKGKTHRGDIIYEYNATKDVWQAPYYYDSSWYVNGQKDLEYPFVLTRDRVISMGVDSNTNSIADSGYIYDGTKPPGTPFTNIHVKSISVPKEITITTGKNYSLPVTYNPSNPTEKGLKSESTDSNIVYGGYDGTLYGKTPGTATVTFITVDGGKRASCRVTVLQSAESITINDGSLSLDIKYGETSKLIANVLPENTYDKSVEWISDDPSVVSVDSKGNIIGKSIGHTYVRAKHKDSGIEDTIYIYVNRVDINDLSIKMPYDKVTYTGKEIIPALTIKNGKKTLVEGTDYTVTCYNNVNTTRSAYIEIQGIGNYYGYVGKNFEIEPIIVQVPEAKKGLVYNGKSQIGVPTGKNYTIEENKATNAGLHWAVASLPSYDYVWSDGDKWSKHIEWEIAAYNVSKTTVDAISNQPYTGNSISPKLIVKHDSVELVENKDYRVEYSNNVEVGKATATIFGLGNYTGEKKVTFNIVEPPHTHSIKKISAKAATCTKAGNKAYWTCTTCKKVFSDSKGAKETTVAKMKIAATGHSLTKTAAKAATCTKAGNKAYWTCSTCKKVFSDSKGAKKTTVEKMRVAAKGHKWDSGKVTKKPTETAEGIKTYTCTACKAAKKETIPKLVHKHELIKTAAKAATCTKAGNKAYWTCSTCKKVFSDSKGAKETTVEKMIIAATGHKWDLGKITKQPTEKAEGVKTYTCSVCKVTKTEKVPQLEPVAPTVTKSVRRAYGDDRYDTAFAISDAYLVDSGKVKSVGDIAGGDRSPSLGAIIVACGTNYPDALAASYLASVKKAPVIVWREKDNAKVQEYIKANLKRGGYVYIMGGTGAVSGNIAKGLSGYKFVRYGDENRYGTNVKILTAAKVTGGEILVCDGTDFKNALIASATGKPILLVKPTGVTREGLAFIAGLNKPSFTIIGNEGSVAASVETQLAGYGKVTRISGNTPDEVSVNVAKKYFKNPKEVMVATSVNFPDGLCGGLLAIQNKAPMLLLTDKQNSKSVAYTKALTSLERVTAFGGSAVVSDALAKKLLNVGTKATDVLEFYRTTDNTTGRPVLMVEPGKI